MIKGLAEIEVSEVCREDAEMGGGIRFGLNQFEVDKANKVNKVHK